MNDQITEQMATAVADPAIVDPAIPVAVQTEADVGKEDQTTRIN